MNFSFSLARSFEEYPAEEQKIGFQKALFKYIRNRGQKLAPVFGLLPTAS
jgi:hypothetical protein